MGGIAAPEELALPRNEGVPKFRLILVFLRSGLVGVTKPPRLKPSLSVSVSRGVICLCGFGVMPACMFRGATFDLGVMPACMFKGTTFDLGVMPACSVMGCMADFDVVDMGCMGGGEVGDNGSAAACATITRFRTLRLLLDIMGCRCELVGVDIGG